MAQGCKRCKGGGARQGLDRGLTARLHRRTAPTSPPPGVTQGRGLLPVPAAQPGTSTTSDHPWPLPARQIHRRTRTPSSPVTTGYPMGQPQLHAKRGRHTRGLSRQNLEGERSRWTCPHATKLANTLTPSRARAETVALKPPPRMPAGVIHQSRGPVGAPGLVQALAAGGGTYAVPAAKKTEAGQGRAR